MLTSKARLPLGDGPNHTFMPSDEDGEETQLTYKDQVNKVSAEYMVRPNKTKQTKQETKKNL